MCYLTSHSEIISDLWKSCKNGTKNSTVSSTEITHTYTTHTTNLTLASHSAGASGRQQTESLSPCHPCGSPGWSSAWSSASSQQHLGSKAECKRHLSLSAALSPSSYLSNKTNQLISKGKVPQCKETRQPQTLELLRHRSPSGK